MIQILLNKYEEVTYDKIKIACAGDKAHVFAKVRVADVFRLCSKSKIGKDYLSFALKAHFDFIVTDDKYLPVFAVEYDGNQHKTGTQAERDEKKNSLCDQYNFSLLRVNSNYFAKKYRGLDLLTYFVDAWFLEKAFSEAQEKGMIPYDEGFDLSSIINAGDTRKKWPYWLSLDSQKKIKQYYDNNMLLESIPSHIVVKDKNNNRLCFAWVKLKNNKYMYAKTGIQKQRFPVILSDIISQIAVIELSSKIDQIAKNTLKPIEEKQFNDALNKFSLKGNVVASCTSGFGNKNS